VNCESLSNLFLEVQAKSGAENFLVGQIDEKELLERAILTASMTTMVEKFCNCGKIDAKNGSDFSDVLKLGSLLMMLE
jgi:hypothetical protein